MTCRRVCQGGQAAMDANTELFVNPDTDAKRRYNQMVSAARLVREARWQKANKAYDAAMERAKRDYDNVLATARRLYDMDAPSDTEVE